MEDAVANCKHAFYFEKNDCWYCDTSMMPVDETCKMACFALPNSKMDAACEFQEKFYNNLENVEMEFQDKCLEIENLDDLIFVLQGHREHYGNIPVHIDLSAGQDEGVYDIEAVLYSTDEDGKESIELIIW
jgi:hypothetical protein